eukprot:UN3914
MPLLQDGTTATAAENTLYIQAVGPYLSAGITLDLKVAYTQADIVPFMRDINGKERDALIKHFLREGTGLQAIDVDWINAVVKEVFPDATVTSQGRIAKALKTASSVSRSSI